ncbi:MAG: glutamate racemase [Gammaproteobacteria bacterium]|nr:glutamate racemase [Gammaproteobacteria bacterium]
MSSGADMPIGIFDSGVGGLTVLHALREQLPKEDLIYLGDTARVPYGTKSPESVQRYAAHAAVWLTERGIKLLVVACNTASAVALDVLRRDLAPLPVIGVIEPGAAAAVAHSAAQRHLVLATEGTAARGAYTEAIRSLNKSATVEELGCSMFVAVAEEGWGGDPIATAVAEKYLASYRSRPASERPDTAILGCTHFPLVSDAIATALGPDITIVDSASTTAKAVAAELDARNLAASGDRTGSVRLVATDSAARFARVGSAFLGEPCTESDIELTDIHPLGGAADRTGA